MTTIITTRESIYDRNRKKRIVKKIKIIHKGMNDLLAQHFKAMAKIDGLKESLRELKGGDINSPFENDKYNAISDKITLEKIRTEAIYIAIDRLAIALEDKKALERCLSLSNF